MTLLGVVIVVAVLRLAQDVFVPLALALLLTFLLAPLVDRLHHWGLHRGLSVVLIVALGCGVVGALLFVVLNQFTDVVQELPRYERQFRHNLSDLTGALRGGVGHTQKAMQEIQAELNRAAPVVAQTTPHVQKVQVIETPLQGIAAVSAWVQPFIKPVGTTAVVIVFVMFMLLRLADLRDRFIRLLGSRNLRVTTEALDDAARRVSRYLVAQTLINTWEGICIAIGLHAIGLPNAVLWGALTTVLRFIPYVGIWVAALMPLVMSFAVFDRWVQPLYVLGLFGAVEIVSYVILEPWLYARRTGVSPVALLVAAAFWAWLWGAAGLFLAIPLTVCLVVMGKYIPQLEFLHVLLGDQPVLAPHERLYQRMLAGNRDEASDLLDQALREESLLYVCDTMILPAIQLTESDYERGALREGKRQYILEVLEHWVDEAETPVDADPSRTGLAAPAEERPFVLCAPAADRTDEICARLLSRVLEERGTAARLLSRGETRTINPDLPQPLVAVVSALPPEAIAHARQLCRRLRLQFQDLTIIVGLWDASGDLRAAHERLASAGMNRLVTGFGACISQIEGLMMAQGRREARDTNGEAPDTLNAPPQLPRAHG